MLTRGAICRVTPTFTYCTCCDTPLTPDKVMAVRIGRASPVLIFAVEPLPQFEGLGVRHPSARILARLAGEPNRAFVLPPLEPMYLREPHITTPKK